MTNHTMYMFRVCPINESWTNLILLIIISIMAITENGVVLMVTCKYEVLRKQYALLLNLIVLDWLTGVFIMVFIVFKLTIRSHALLDAAIGIMINTAVILSLSTVMVITFDRFLNSIYLEEYNMATKKIFFMILLWWCVPGLLTNIIFIYDEFNMDAVQVLSLAFFIIYYMTIITLFIAIHIMLQQQSRNTKNIIRRLYLNNQKKCSRTVLVISALLFLTHTSTMTIHVTNNLFQKFYYISGILLTLNSAMNPFVYWFRIPVLRKYILNFLQGKYYWNKRQAKRKKNSTFIIEDRNSEIILGRTYFECRSDIVAFI